MPTVRGAIAVAVCLAATGCGGSGGGGAPARDATVADATPVAAGPQLYARYCVACHGAGGTGTPVAPRPLRDGAFLAATSDSAIRDRIANGIPGTAMAPWGRQLSAADVEALVGVIRGFAPTSAATTTATPSPDGN